ncbi:MAG: alpha/beta fold hydrolase [Pseudomonadota bacterium]
MLRVVDQGQGDVPVVIVHGLFGSARNWGAISKRMAETRRILTVDMRNHGESFRADTNTYVDMADDLAKVIAAHCGVADVIGHSMGGKAAMVLALSHPNLVRRLVVADIAPVAYSHTQLHLIAAMQGLDLSAIDTRSQADAALTAQIAEPGVRAFLLQSLDLRGRRWLLNLDVLAAEMPKIIGWPDIEGPYSNATLFLSGGASDYVLPSHRAQIKRLFPKATFAKVTGAGHWLHAEKPREFQAAVEAYLDH